MDAMVSYEAFSSDLPAERRLPFNSVEENEGELRRYGLDLAVRQTGNGLYRSDLVAGTTAEATLLSQRINVALTMHVQAPADTVVFLFPRWVSGQYTVSGVNLGHESVLVLPESAGAEISIQGLAGSDGIFVRTSRYLEMAAALDPTLEPTESMAVLQGDRSQLNLLRKLFGTLMTHPRLDVRGEYSRWLLTHVVSCHADAVARGQCDNLHNRTDRIRCARRAADFIEENYAQEVRMDALCLSTGVGIRTLQRCFREHFGVNVTEYLKAVRLDSIYRTLDKAAPCSTTVAHVGIENGYTHLGRLSVQFRERFGKLPSEVLSGKLN